MEGNQMNEDDPEDNHIVMHVVIQKEPLQPRWLRTGQTLGSVTLIILAVSTAIALVTRSPWLEILSRVTNVMTMIMLVIATVLFLRTGAAMRRDRQEMARVETRLYKQWMDLKVENDRAGRPPLLPPPDL